jgi:hypothetical protein
MQLIYFPPVRILNCTFSPSLVGIDVPVGRCKLTSFSELDRKETGRGKARYNSYICWQLITFSVRYNSYICWQLITFSVERK